MLYILKAFIAGDEGIEPPPKVLETTTLPLKNPYKKELNSAL